MYEDDFFETEEVLEEEEDTLSGKYLTFKVDKEMYGIEIRFVIEIINLVEITKVPDMPSYICGVINLRDNIIPVMEIRKRFNVSSKEFDSDTCIIVIDVEGVSIGVIVDSVSEVIAIPDENLQSPPKVTKTKASVYIRHFGKVDKNVFILLDVKKLLYQEDLDKLKNEFESV